MLFLFYLGKKRICLKYKKAAITLVLFYVG